VPDLAIIALVPVCTSLALLVLPGNLAVGSRASGFVMAARYRGVSLLAVAAFGCLLRGFFPESNARDEASYLVVLTLGYGHLGGAAWFSLGRLRAQAGASLPLLALFALTSVATLFAAWSWLANEGMSYLAPYFLWIFFGLFAVSTWHVIENDIALARSYSRGLRIPGRSRHPGDRLVALTVTATLTGLGVYLVRSPLPWLSFGDFFSALVLYHLLGWLVFFADRARRLEALDRRRLLARLGLAHLPPAALAGLLMAWTPLGLVGLREMVLSPGVYSFFALLHVLQTAWVRGREVRHAG